MQIRVSNLLTSPHSVYSDEFETKQVDEIYKIKNGDLAKGVYFLHILSNEKRRILPLIIQ